MHLIHRGIVNNSFKENLLKSFEAAFKKGYGIETDIHATKDEQFVCFHDFTLKRIYKIKKSIKNINYAEVITGLKNRALLMGGNAVAIVGWAENSSASGMVGKIYMCKNKPAHVHPH